MGRRSNGQWQTLQPQRRSTDSHSSLLLISNESLASQEMVRISERLAEIKRIVQANALRRLAAGNQSSISVNSNLLPSTGPKLQMESSVHTISPVPPQLSHLAVPPPSVPPPNTAPTYHYLPSHSPIPTPPTPSTWPAHVPVPFVPPPPYMDDIFRDFSLSPPQEYLAHQDRLYQ